MTNDAALGPGVMNDRHWSTFKVSANLAAVSAELIHDLRIEVVQFVGHVRHGNGFV